MWNHFSHYLKDLLLRLQKTGKLWKFFAKKILPTPLPPFLVKKFDPSASQKNWPPSQNSADPPPWKKSHARVWPEYSFIEKSISFSKDAKIYIFFSCSMQNFQNIDKLDTYLIISKIITLLRIQIGTPGRYVCTNRSQPQSISRLVYLSFANIAYQKESCCCCFWCYCSFSRGKSNCCCLELLHF